MWGTLSFEKRLLIWDAYRCHMMDSVKHEVNKVTNADICMIPGGLTSLVQPADVSWNKPFKDAYRNLYDHWMANGEKSYTPSGNLRAPSKILCLQWVRRAWESVTKEVVCKSFKMCGISVNSDGSKDVEIHCIKSGNVAEDATAEIARQTAALSSSMLADDSDPFADIEDEGQLETNELVIEDDDDEQD